MKKKISKAEAKAFRKRWEEVNAAEIEELRSMPPARKMQQISALMISAKAMGWTKVLAREEEEVRERWLKLRKALGGQAEIPVPLLDVLRDLTHWLESRKIPHIVIGGVAASLLGRPRLTRDVDVLVAAEKKDWEDLLRSGEEFGFLPRRQDALQFAEKSRVLLLQHKTSGIEVDAIFAGLAFEKEAISRKIAVRVGKVTVSLPTPDDLIVMKAVGNRPRDLADIESLIQIQPRLNIRRIRRLLKEFSTAMDKADILKDFESTLAKASRTKKRKPGARGVKR